MKKLLTVILPAALLLSSCDFRESLYVQVPETVWTQTVDSVSTWLCFHDDENASLLQYSLSSNRSQIDHGTYTTKGHSVIISTEFASEYTVNRTFMNLKRKASNYNYTQLSPYAYPSLAGSVWISPVSNDLHLAFFPSDDECVDLLYSNITREETGSAYGWAGVKKAVTRDGSEIAVGGMSATTYKNVICEGHLAAGLIGKPLEEEGSSSLKGTVWVYNNTGYPADVPSAVIFTGKDSFIRIIGAWTGNVSDVRVAAIVFDVSSGTYSENGGTLTLSFGDKNESCSVSGSSFTLFEKSYRKLDY